MELPSLEEGFDELHYVWIDEDGGFVVEGGKMKLDELTSGCGRSRRRSTCVLPGVYMVARLDGRSFTRLTKEAHQFEAPFDPASATTCCRPPNT